jgi:chemotaxis protein MotB
MGGVVHTRMETRGLVVSLGEGGFFASGSDQLKFEGRKLLDSLAQNLSLVENQIRVEGHTDTVPIHTLKFPSNWELSTARATRIISYLVREFGFSPEKLSAAGYGEFRPIATNDTPEGRARNRRVDIVVLNSSSSRSEPK